MRSLRKDRWHFQPSYRHRGLSRLGRVRRSLNMKCRSSIVRSVDCSSVGPSVCSWRRMPLGKNQHVRTGVCASTQAEQGQYSQSHAADNVKREVHRQRQKLHHPAPIAVRAGRGLEPIGVDAHLLDKCPHVRL